MKMWLDSIERETEIILPAIIRENWYGERLIPEVAMVQKEEFNKVPNELIRCKDCRFGELTKDKEDDKLTGYTCKWIDGLHSEFWFCGYGKRKYPGD